MENIIPSIVGSIFLAIGLFQIFDFFYKRQHATKVKGIVIAVERFISRSRSTGSDDSSASVLYRPIVEYHWQGEKLIVRGVGRNTIKHRLQQPLDVLVLQSKVTGKVQAIVNTNSYILIGTLFILFGAVPAFWLHFYAVEGSAILPLILSLVFSAIAFGMFHGSGFSNDNEENYQVIHKENNKDSIILDTEQALRDEIANYNKKSYFIITLFFCFALVALYFGSLSFTAELKQLYQSADPAYIFDTIKDNGLSDESIKSMLLLCFGGFILFASVMSTIQIFRNRY